MDIIFQSFLEYFLLKLVNQTFWGYSYTNNSINENIVYNNSHFELKSKYNNTNNTILNKINIYFYVGKNLTSNKDLLILEKKYFNSNKTIFLFFNINDIDIDINIYADKNISLFEAKIRKAKIYSEKYNGNKEFCFASIQMIFNINDYLSDINNYKYKNEILRINSIDVNRYDIIITPSRLESNSIIKIDNTNKDKTEYKHYYEIFFLSLIMFPIINIIYILKIMINIAKEKISDNSICYVSFWNSFFCHAYYWMFSSKFTKILLMPESFWINKILVVLNFILPVINFAFNYYFLTFFCFCYSLKGNNGVKLKLLYILLQ